MLGAAIATSTMCVGTRCLWVEASAGALASQNYTDPRLGRLGLELLRMGYGAQAVVDRLIRAGAYPEFRQITCVDRDGQSAVWSGNQTVQVHSQHTGRNVAAAGNFLASCTVIEAMVQAFLGDDARHLGQCLVGALAAGKAAGGESGGNERSVAVKVCDRDSVPILDLRIDWDERNPVAALSALWERYRPEMPVYLLRAVDPTAAPFDLEDRG